MIFTGKFTDFNGVIYAVQKVSISSTELLFSVVEICGNPQNDCITEFQRKL
jgi:hypothetical protein